MNEIVKIRVRNSGSRPIHIGSRFNFADVNKSLEFDRRRAAGLHLNIPEQSVFCFAPGDEIDVELVPFSNARKRKVIFHNLHPSYAGLIDFPAYYPKKLEAFKNIECRM